MWEIKSYVCGSWQAGSDEEAFELLNPATGQVIGRGSVGGLDLASALSYARETGGAALRAMSFAERAEMLAEVSKALHAQREHLIAIAIENGGNTRKDAKFDIDGATGTLHFYSRLGAELGDTPWIADGDAIPLSGSARWSGQHLWVPRAGAAIHINAFNFPAWGTFEKAAAAWLAGMPVVSKPAPATAILAYEMTRILVEADILPEGAFQLIAGPPGDLLSHVESQDVVAFTGSGATGRLIRGLDALREKSVRVNIEADSVNAAVLGPDVSIGSETWHLFIRDVMTDLRQKAGQKCTAIRRVLVPDALLEDVPAELADRVNAIRVGDPSEDGVEMGPVTNAQQQEHVRGGLTRLVEGGAEIVSEHPGVPDEGFFVTPTLLAVESADAVPALHEHEVFGPVVTLIPYAGEADEAVAIVNRGAGGLVTSVYSDDARGFVQQVVLGVAPYHGRVYVGDEKCAAQAFGPGVVLPQLVHGGPGRAGCGEELGGERALRFYMQRVAVQGSRKVIGRVFS